MTYYGKIGSERPKMISKIGSYAGFALNGVQMITMRGRDTFGLFTGSEDAKDMRIFFF